MDITRVLTPMIFNKPIRQFNLFILTFILGNTTLTANEQALDGIAALVNNDIIMLSEVRQAAGRNKAANPSLSDQALIRETLNELILKTLQQQRAKTAGIEINDAVLNQAMSGLAKQNKLTDEQFKLALAREGYEYNSFKRDLREQLKLEALKNAVIRQRSKVPASEVENLIDNQILHQSNNNRYHLEDILIPLPKGSNIQQFDRTQQAAYQLRKQLLGQHEFLQHAAVKRMQNHFKITTTNLGWKSSKQLSPAFQLALSKLGPNEISNVVRDAQGFHILKLTKLQTDQAVVKTQVRARHILIDKQQADAKNQVSSIRQQIIGGADFGTLAKKLSTDSGSAKNGGDLGWANSSDYVAPFAHAVNTLPLNTLSQPVQTRFGWHLIEVLERKTGNTAREALKLEAEKQLSTQNQQQKYQQWLQNLRDEAYIEVRLKP